MTNIICFWDDHDNIVRIEVCGHTGYRKRGEDIVCAAVSSIMQLLCVGIREVLGISEGFSVDKDNVCMTCNIPRYVLPSIKEKGYVFTKSAQIFMTQLEKQYNEYINVENRRCVDNV